jgi:hypothetical protein
VLGLGFIGEIHYFKGARSMAVFEPKGIVSKETEKSIFKDGASFRIWMDKKSKAIRLKFYDLDSVYYISKGSKLYYDLAEDFFDIERPIETDVKIGNE